MGPGPGPGKKIRLVNGPGPGRGSWPAGWVRVSKNPARTQPVAIPNLEGDKLESTREKFEKNSVILLIII